MGNYLDRIRRLEAEKQLTTNVDATNSNTLATDRKSEEYELNEINELNAQGSLADPSQIGGHQLGEELDRLIRLGYALATGEIVALRCGKTGLQCKNCGGIPCLWSSRL